MKKKKGLSGWIGWGEQFVFWWESSICSHIVHCSHIFDCIIFGIIIVNHSHSHLEKLNDYIIFKTIEIFSEYFVH